MNNPMDRFQFQQQNLQQTNIFEVFNQARQNPKLFEDNIKRNNPQAYQKALQLRDSFVNPQQAVMQIVQQRGFNPNILKMFNL